MVSYVSRDEIDVEKALRVLAVLDENERLYPWTVVSRAVNESEDVDSFRMDVLKPLVLEGYVMVDADGRLFIDERSDFKSDYL